MPDVFVSYAREDQRFVRRLDQALTERGLDGWVDWEGILPSAEWMGEIEAAIEGSDSFVFVVSPDSVASPMCTRELDHARRLQKRIVPVVVRPVDPDDAPAAVRERNWVFCTDTDDFAVSVDTLVSALALDLDWVHAHTRLLVRTIDWETHDRDRSLLLRGSDLVDAEQWLADAGRHEAPAPTPAQIGFLAASRRGVTRSTRIRIGALSAALVVTVVLAAVALVQRNEARRQTRLAEGRALVASSSAALPDDPELSLWFAIRALDTSPSVQADKLLRRAFLESRIRATYRVHGSPDRPEYRVVAVAPDLRHALVHDSESGSDSVRDLATGKQGVRFELTELPVSASFNPDGTHLAVGGAVWSVTTGTKLFDLSPPTSSASFTSDGTRLFGPVSSGVMVWDDHGTPVGPALPTRDPERAADHDASRVLTWSGCNGCNDLPTVWDVATGQPRSVLGDPDVLGAGSSTPNAPKALVGTAPTTAAAFSPDGKYIATGDGAGVVRIWLVESPRTPVAEFHMHTAQVSSLEFSQDDTRVLSGAQDGTARVVVLATGKAEYDLRGHAAPVVRAEFGTGDTRVATIHSDETVRVWDTRPFRAATAPFTPIDLTNLQIDDPARRVFGSTRDGGVGVWELSSGRRLLGLNAHRTTPFLSPRSVLDAAMSSDGKRVVATEPSGKTARVWDVDAGRPVARLQGEGDFFHAPSLDARGTRATATGSGGVRIWDARSGALLRTVRVRSAGQVVLDPRGDRMVVVGGGSASIWDPSDGRRIATLTGCCRDLFHRFVFSADGSRLLTVESDGSARLWDTDSGRQLRRGFRSGSNPTEPQSSVAVAAFGEGDRRVLTVSSNGGLGVWDAESGELLVEPPSFTVNVQLGVAAAGFSRDRTRVAVVLGSAYEYECAVCGSTRRVLRESRGHVSTYVRRHATSLALH